MDKLEKFITQHRDAFDEAVPSLKVWAEINKELDQQKGQARRIFLWRSLRVAAAVVALLLVGGYGGMYYQQQVASANITLSDIAPEYAELEAYYTTQVSLRMQQLADYSHTSAVEPDLQQLDEVLQELQQELKNAPLGGEEQVINAMINNYKTRLEILERVLEKIQSTNQNLKTETDEVVSI
jgi:NADH dehydrogenase/NADH:ubiquinone oxidoreductase subunit G